MVAATKYTEDAILDATAAEIASAGFDRASVASIARALGAPSGSLYHRFPSKKQLISALWTRTARRYAASLNNALQTTQPEDLPLRIVDHTFDWVATHPLEANLLMQFRTEDFTAGDWPPEVIAAIEETNNQLAQQIVSTAELHHVNPIDMTLATIDIPAAAARRAILTNAEPAVEEHIRRRATELVSHLIHSD